MGIKAALFKPAPKGVRLSQVSAVEIWYNTLSEVIEYGGTFQLEQLSKFTRLWKPIYICLLTVST